MNPLKKIYALNGAQIVVLLVEQIAIVPIYLHYLGIQGYEDWVFINAAAAICQLFDFGLIFYVSNTARIAYGLGKPDTAENVVRMGLSFWWILFALFTMFSFSCGFFAQTTRVVALAILFFNSPLEMLRSWLSYILTARTSQVGELVLFIFYRLLQTVALVCVSLFYGKVLALAMTQVATTVTFGIIPLLLTLHRYAPELKLKPRKVNTHELKEIITGSLTNFSYSAASVAIIQLPIILLGLIPNLPPASLATFTTSRTLTGVVRQFCSSFARSNGIEISRLLGPEHAQRMRRVFLLGSATIAVLAAAGMGGLLPIADIVLKIWTGKPELYDPAVVGIFCVFAVLSAQLQLPMILPQFTNTARIMAMPLFLQVSFVAVLGFGASSLYGASGMVVALGIAELSTLGFVSLRRIIPQMGISRLRFLALSGGLSLGIFIVSFIASFAARHFVHPSTLLELGYSGIIWTIIMSPLLGFLYQSAKKYRWS
ncbi:MAG: hypothetical protein P4L42_15235 [Desulfocapsaceae bacterium]|nr:hypothetical protein [Desulfocapsaceae bacterium]